MTGSFSLGTLTAYLGADTTQFKKELMQASALMQNTGKQMTAVGKQMSMSLTAPLVAAGAVFTKVSADFEKSLNQVKAVSGATDAQMEQLANQARDLGKSTKFSAKEVADGMSFLSMAGFSVQETMDALASTLHLASAGNMELAESADIVSNIMQGFGKSADKTAEVVDILTKTFTTSNTNLSQLGLAMSYVAPVAKAFGQEITMSSAAIGILSDAGIQGTRAGTGLRQVLTQLSSKANQLGFAVQDTNGRMLPLVDILKNVEEAGTSTDKIISILGTRAGTAMAALMDRGSAALEDFTAELQDAGGTAERVANTQMRGLSGAFTEFKSAMAELSISFGNSGMLSMFEKIVDWAKEIVLSLSNLDDSTKNIILIIGGVVAALGPLLIIMGTLVSTVLPALLTGLTVLTGPFGIIIAAITAATIAYTSLSSSVNSTNKIMKDTKDVIGKASAEYIVNKQRVDNLIQSLKSLNAKETLTAIELDTKKKIISELNGVYGTYLDKQITERTSLEELQKAQIKVNEGLKENILLKAKSAQEEQILAKKIEGQQEAYEKLDNILKKQGVSSIADRASMISEAFEEGLTAQTRMWAHLDGRGSSAFQQASHALVQYNDTSRDAEKSLQFLNSEFDVLKGTAAQMSKQGSFIPAAAIESSKEYIELQKEGKKINEEIAAIPYNKIIPDSLLQRAKDYNNKLKDLNNNTEENTEEVDNTILSFSELQDAYKATTDEIQELLAQGNPVPLSTIQNANSYKKELDAIADKMEQVKTLGTFIKENDTLSIIPSISPEQIPENTPKTEKPTLQKFPVPSQEDIAGVDQFAKTWEQASIDIEAAINAAAQAAVIGSAEMLGSMLASGAGLGDIVSGIGTLIGGTLADLMIQVGQIAIGVGLTIEGIQEALMSLNPVVAIAAGVALVALGSFVKGQLKKVAAPQGLATGGEVITSGAFMVGEKGPELVNLPRGAAVTPNHALQQTSGNGGELTVRLSGKELEFVLNQYKQDKLRY